ncbi:MAG TPA: LysR family transcriptional regulator [Clostridiales bacterium]|nr:LysR family transcriptional regulator [Clostridiales bacterium]
MTLNQLRYFVEVCRQGSITKAAEVLHVSQPSISNAILDLEEELGVNLFHRIKMRLSPTQEGYYFFQGISRILSRLDLLVSDMQDMGKKNKMIRIGVPPMIGTFLFPDIFDLFHKEYPDVMLEMVEYGSLKTQEMVLSEELDVALAVTEEKETRLNHIHLMRTSLLYCVDKSHPIAGAKSIALEDLDNTPVILMQEGSYQTELLQQLFLRLNIHPKIIMYSNQLYTIKHMLTRSQAGAFMFEHVLKMHPDLVGIPLKEPIDLNISLIWKKDRHLYSYTSQLIEIVKRHYSKKSNESAHKSQ